MRTNPYFQNDHQLRGSAESITYTKQRTVICLAWCVKIAFVSNLSASS